MTPSPAHVARAGHDVRLVPAALATWSAAALAVGIPAAASLGLSGAAALGVTAAAWAASRRGWRVPGALWLAGASAALAFLACALHVAARDSSALGDLAAQGTSVSVVAQVTTDPRAAGEYRDMHALTVSALRVEGPYSRPDSASLDVITRLELADATRQGAQLRITGDLAPALPGTAAAATLFATEISVVAPAAGYHRWVGQARDAIRGLGEGHGDPGALLVGMTMGDTSQLSAAGDAAMRTSSLTHLTAVSGAHVALVLAVTAAGVGAVIRNRGATVAAAGAALVAFVGLVGPAPSVLRSAAMGVVTLIALLAGRRRAALPALCAAVILLVLIQPWLARSVGLALSVLATAALVVVAPRWAARLATVAPARVAFALAVPAAAQVACTPVLVMLSGELAIGGVIANLLAAPAVAPATICGLLAGGLVHIHPALAEPVAWLGRTACAWIEVVAVQIARHPWMSVSWPTQWWGVVGASALVAAGVWGAFRLARCRRRALVACAVGALLVVAAALPQVWRPVRQALGAGLPADWAVLACDVGQGTAWAIRTGPHAAVLIDTGPPGGGVGGCLHDAGVTHLDLLIVTHVDLDHIGDLADGAGGRSVGRVLVGVGCAGDSQIARAHRLLTDAGLSGEPMDVASAPVTGGAGEVTWTVMAPPARVCPAGGGEESSANDGSLVAVFTTPAGVVVTLGDLEPAAQAAMRRPLREVLAGRAVDIVSVPHHGSKNQLAALAHDLRARLALVSAGRDNDYGHPAPATVELYTQAGGTVVSTHECGNIWVVAQGTGPRPAHNSARCPS